MFPKLLRSRNESAVFSWKKHARFALGDIVRYSEGAYGYQGDEEFQVASGGTPPAINAGEPVTRALGATAFVTAMTTNKPVVATDFLAGISTTTSTETSTVAGLVRVEPLNARVSYLIAPKVTATYGVGATPVQATYDALIGSRVLLDLTTGVYTILAVDGATSGCVVLPLDVVKFPGKVRFAFRNGVNFLT